MTPAVNCSDEALEGKGVSETKAIRIASVKSASEYTLRIRWVNGKTLAVDLQEPIHRLKGMRALRDKAAFAQASKGEGGHSVVWPGGIDMGADRLWIRLSKNVSDAVAPCCCPCVARGSLALHKQLLRD
jgi:hypothetical protein